MIIKRNRMQPTMEDLKFVRVLILVVQLLRPAASLTIPTLVAVRASPEPIALVGEACPNPSCSTLPNGACSYGECVCASGFYDPGDKTCTQRTGVGSTCSAAASDTNPCTFNASCAAGRCICDRGFFNMGGLCRPRIAPEHACIGTMNQAEQCVDYASCVGNQCTCDASYYHSQGACHPRVQLDQVCNRTIANVLQCVDNARCTETDNRHICHCVAGYHNDSEVCKQISDPENGSDTAKIVAGVVTPLVVLALIAAAMWLYRKKVGSNGVKPEQTPDLQERASPENEAGEGLEPNPAVLEVSAPPASHAPVKYHPHTLAT